MAGPGAGAELEAGAEAVAVAAGAEAVAVAVGAEVVAVANAVVFKLGW